MSSPLSLPSMPSEVLLLIAEKITRYWELNALVRTNRRFYDLLNPFLYKKAIRPSIPYDGQREAMLYHLINHGLDKVLDWVLEYNDESKLPTEYNGVEMWKPWRMVHLSRQTFAMREEGCLRVLLRHGADAAILGDDTMFEIVRADYAASTMRLVVDGGANIDARNSFFAGTPLLLAASLGNNDAMRNLLELGADIEARDRYGATALAEVVKQGSQLANIEGIELLLKNGANVENAGNVLHIAAGRGQIGVVRMLVEYGADSGGLYDGRTPLQCFLGYRNSYRALHWEVDYGVGNLFGDGEDEEEEEEEEDFDDKSNPPGTREMIALLTRKVEKGDRPGGLDS